MLVCGRPVDQAVVVLEDSSPSDLGLPPIRQAGSGVASESFAHSKTKGSADLLKNLPGGAKIEAVEKVTIEIILNSYGDNRREHYRRRI
jgi:hypothetical protein